MRISRGITPCPINSKAVVVSPNLQFLLMIIAPNVWRYRTICSLWCRLVVCAPCPLRNAALIPSWCKCGGWNPPLQCWDWSPSLGRAWWSSHKPQDHRSTPRISFLDWFCCLSDEIWVSTLGMCNLHTQTSLSDLWGFFASSELFHNS